jgi:hypothetical protein
VQQQNNKFLRLKIYEVNFLSVLFNDTINCLRLYSVQILRRVLHCKIIPGAVSKKEYQKNHITLIKGRKYKSSSYCIMWPP